MRADDELHPYLFLLIHITGKLLHIALYPLILERISQVASTGILLSHRHLDHCADINVLIEAMTEGGFKKRGKIFIPSDAIAQDPVIYEFIREKPEEIIILQPNHTYGLKSISFKTTNLLAHPVETYGFNFALGTEKISFVTGCHPECCVAV